MTAKSTPNSKKAKPDDTGPQGVVQVTARIPIDLHERLRRYTFEERVSLNSLILEGLEAVLKRKR